MSAKVYGPLSFTSLAGFDGSGASQITPVAKSVFLCRITIAASWQDINDGIVVLNDSKTQDFFAFVSDLATHDLSTNYFNPITGAVIDPTQPEGYLLVPEWVGYIGDTAIRPNVLSGTGLSFASSIEYDGTNPYIAPIYKDSGSKNRTITVSQETVALCQFKTGW